MISGLSLIFPSGQRPSVADILRLAATRVGDPGSREDGPGFAVSHQPPAAEGWLELLSGGLTFDLSGLSPASAAPMPAMAHWYGFAERPAAETGEAITLVPGEHLRGAENLLPVVRTMAGTAARLAELAGVTAVVWHPARSVMAPGPFVSAITGWLQGGAFPALGLTALYRDVDGAIRSEGLGFFTGQELRIEPSLPEKSAQDAKIAARLVHELVGNAAIEQMFKFIGPNGEDLCVEPSDNGRCLKVWGKT